MPKVLLAESPTQRLRLAGGKGELRGAPAKTVEI